MPYSVVFSHLLVKAIVFVLWESLLAFLLRDFLPNSDMISSYLYLKQSVEWTEEPMDEGKTESPLVVTDGASTINLEKKEEGSGTEENEWDKLLRVR